MGQIGKAIQRLRQPSKKKKKNPNPRGVGKDESSDFAEREREGGLRQRA